MRRAVNRVNPVRRALSLNHLNRVNTVRRSVSTAGITSEVYHPRSPRPPRRESRAKLIRAASASREPSSPSFLPPRSAVAYEQ